jgi:hypothetical protein
MARNKKLATSQKGSWNDKDQGGLAMTIENCLVAPLQLLTGLIVGNNPASINVHVTTKREFWGVCLTTVQRAPTIGVPVFQVQTNHD